MRSVIAMLIVIAVAGCASTRMKPATSSNILGTRMKETPACASRITFSADSRVLVVTAGLSSTGTFRLEQDIEREKPSSTLSIEFEGGLTPADDCSGSKKVEKGEPYVANVRISTNGMRMEIQPQYMSLVLQFSRQ